MRKLLLIVLLVRFFSLFADEPLIKPEEEPDLYKTEISQVTPQSGISTGHVIAYGHYIKPPYKFEIMEDALLFLNGVRIYPALPSKFEIERKKREKIMIEEMYRETNRLAKPYFDKQDSLFEKIRRVYKAVEQEMGRDKAIDSVFKIAEEDTLAFILDTTLFGRDDCYIDIEYAVAGYDSPVDIILKLHGSDSTSGFRPRKVRDINMMKEYVNNMKMLTERVLRNHTVIIYTCEDSGFHSEYDLWKILKILKSNILDMNEKISKLSEITNENAAKELVYNFNPSEWPEKKVDK